MTGGKPVWIIHRRQPDSVAELAANHAGDDEGLSRGHRDAAPFLDWGSALSCEA